MGRKMSKAVLGRVAVLLLLPSALLAQQTGAIEGRVTDLQNEPVHHATVLIVQIGATVETDHDGVFHFTSVKPGTYDVFAEAARLTSQVKLIDVQADTTTQVELVLVLSPVSDSVTVTARGKHETTFEAVQSVATMDTFDIAEKASVSLGEVLDGELGVAKRSFGPGSARPVIRGFDGDRVLVLKDGMRTGSVGSQSGDHGESIDPGNLERLEVVKGPATLLYGSNAIGGVVNAITRHHEMHKHRHEGIRGQITAALGSNNGLAGGNSSVEYGSGNWMFWGGGGGQRTGDYQTPEGTVKNSKARVANGRFGSGWFGDRFYLSGAYGIVDGRYGIPFATAFHEGLQDGGDHQHEAEPDAIDVDWKSRDLRFNTGVHDLHTVVEEVRVGLSYTEWRHDEVEIFPDGDEMVGTAFSNKQFTYRGDVDHTSGPFTGTFGVWGTTRDYKATGEEALSPPVDQNGIAVFALEELNHEKLRLQFGARLEHARYDPKAAVERPQPGGHQGSDFVDLPKRRFSGFSGSAGVRLGLWDDGAFVGHFTSSYRAPALEELYNFGPHVGNLAFEIGNPALGGERSNGVDLSLRHSGSRFRAEGNFFYYHISDFIYGAPTGEVEGGLFVLEYDHGDSRFVGSEVGLDLALSDSLWLNTGLDVVDARLEEGQTPLPRIPPLRGRIALDFRRGLFSFRPELVLASRRDEVFPTETDTAGYGVVNLKASYTLPSQHFAHYFAFEVFNVGDKVYRNHVSFIKDLALEIGRGVRFSYAVRFF